MPTSAEEQRLQILSMLVATNPNIQNSVLLDQAERLYRWVHGDTQK